MSLASAIRRLPLPRFGRRRPADAVADLWARTAEARRGSGQFGWLDSPVIFDHHLGPALGRLPGETNWLQTAARRHAIPPRGHWLSLGCGGGGAEVIAAKSGLFATMDAIDLSAGALDVARRAARAARVTNVAFRAGDLNGMPLPECEYDVVTMSMSLHHVADLEGLLGRVRASLRPGGWFLVNEYIGPSQIQYGPVEMELVEDVLALLPPGLKFDYVAGRPKDRYEVKSREWWDAADPSEAVCSDRIEAELARRFRVEGRYGYGGALLAPLLEHIVANFSKDDPEHVALLRLLSLFERTLVGGGVLPDYFAVFALRAGGQ